jgi:hypothetical protein
MTAFTLPASSGVACFLTLPCAARARMGDHGIPTICVCTRQEASRRDRLRGIGRFRRIKLSLDFTRFSVGMVAWNSIPTRDERSAELLRRLNRRTATVVTAARAPATVLRSQKGTSAELPDITRS